MSFPKYPIYRNSGVEWLGEIPRDWKVLPLCAVAHECHQPNEGMVDSNLLSLSYGKIVRKDINENDGLLPASFETYQIVEAGDVVWRLTDLQNDKRSLRTAIVEERGIITSAYLATRPHGVAPRYLNYLLRAYDQRKVFYAMGGGLRQAMKFADVKRIPLLVPSDSEQEKIVAVLDRETAKIDDLVSEQRRLIALLKEKRQAIISNAVTGGLYPSASKKDSGIEWLGEIPSHWEAMQWRRLVTQIEQGWSPECLSRPAEAEEWGVLKTGCVNGGEYTEAENKALPPDLQPAVQYEVQVGDILMSRASGSADLIGSVALVRETNGRIMLSDKIFRLRLDGRCDPSFFAWAAASKSTRGQIVAAISGAEGMANNLPQSSIKAFALALPPLEEQRDIARYLSRVIGQIDRLSAASEAAVALFQERRAALISAAVTGKIDVRSSATSYKPERVRDVACAEIIRISSAKPTFGRVKFQKLAYLAEAHSGIVEIGGSYAREAAGPLDRHMMQNVEQSLSDRGIADVQQAGGSGSQVTYKFVGDAKAVSAEAEELLGEKCARLRDLIKRTADLDTKATEAVATLYAVWNDEQIDGRTPTDEQIIAGVLNDWHPEKPKKFTADDLTQRLGWMRRNGIVPNGTGPKTYSPRLFA